MSGKRGILEERFWRKVNKTESCWLWTGGTARGYGKIDGKLSGKKCMLTASRVSWEIHNGPIPIGMLVCHRCDVRACVNPAHLFLGTQKDNMVDCARKDRICKKHSPKGSKHGNAKLTEEQVVEIRRRRSAGEKLASIGADFSVGQALISGIVLRRTWKHVP